MRHNVCIQIIGFLLAWVFTGTVCLASQSEVRTLEEVREELLVQFPQWKINTFQHDIYTLGDRVRDSVAHEALAAGATLSTVAVTHLLQASLQKAFGLFLGRHGSLVTDITVDGLTSESWLEFCARTGVTASAWLLSEQASPPFLLFLRYFASHWHLLAETVPDIWQSLLPALKGSRTLFCGRGGSCGAVKVTYRVPDKNFAPETGRPWLELTFPPDATFSSPENDFDQSLLDLREWALDQSISEIDLYPVMDNGHRKLMLRFWKNDQRSSLMSFPGVFSEGAECWWWTDVMAEKSPEVRVAARRLINPLHYDVIRWLPDVLSGEAVPPVLVKTEEQIVGEKRNLVGVPTGHIGFLVFDQHQTQGYELPEIWLLSSLPLDHVRRQALRSLDLRRASGEWRGAWKLGETLVRASIHRQAMDWAVAKLKRYADPSESSHSELEVQKEQCIQVEMDAPGEESAEREEVDVASVDESLFEDAAATVHVCTAKKKKKTPDLSQVVPDKITSMSLSGKLAPDDIRTMGERKTELKSCLKKKSAQKVRKTSKGRKRGKSEKTTQKKVHFATEPDDTNEQGSSELQKVLVLGKAGSGKYSMLNWVLKGDIASGKIPSIEDGEAAHYPPFKIDGTPVEITVLTVSDSDLLPPSAAGLQPLSRRVINALLEADKVLWVSSHKKIRDSLHESPDDDLFNAVAKLAKEQGKPAYASLTHNDLVVTSGFSSSRKDMSLIQQAHRLFQQAQGQGLAIGRYFIGLSGTPQKGDPAISLAQWVRTNMVPNLDWLQYWRLVLTRDEEVQGMKAREVMDSAKKRIEQGENGIWQTLFPEKSADTEDKSNK